MDDVLKINDDLVEHDFIRLFSQAPAPIALYKGRQLQYVFANNAYLEIFNYRDIIGKTVREAFPELEGQGYYEILEGVFDTGQPYEGKEIPANIDVSNSGRMEKRYYNLIYTPYTNNEGIRTGVMAFGHDVTSQVLARQKVEFAEENARLAIESADLGTYEINLQTNEMHVSRRFREIWGFDRDTTRRNEFASVIHPNDRAARESAHIQSLKTGNLQYEARVMQNDHSYRWVKVKGTVLFDRLGAPVRLLGMIQDITEQKVFAEELSKKVEERTKELKEINEQLANSNEQLEQFAYIASHDLQEPLRKIQIFNSFLRDEKQLSDKAAYYIEKINSSALRMTGLIKDLLEYSRLSQKTRHYESTDLNVILQRIKSDFEVLIVQKQAVIYADQLPVIQSISLQMNQLFYNIVGNALKFTRDGVIPTIKITCDEITPEQVSKYPDLDATKKYYEIRITDNGIGFNQDYAAKIFTIFQRLNAEAAYDGFGIGLALCHKIVTNHGGHIYARGRPGKGAMFGFVLPA